MSTLDKEQTQKAAEDLAAVVDNALGKTKDTLHDTVESSKKVIAESLENPKDQLTGFLDSSKQNLTDIYDSTKAAAGSVVDKTAELGHAASHKTGAAVSAMSEQFVDLYEDTKQAAGHTFEKVTGTGSGDVEHATTDTAAKTSESGSDALNITTKTFADGTADTVDKDVISDAYNATKEPAGHAFEAVKNQEYTTGDITSDTTIHAKESPVASSDYLTSLTGDAVSAAQEASHVTETAQQGDHKITEKIQDFTEQPNTEQSTISSTLENLHTDVSANLSSAAQVVGDKAHDFVDLTTESINEGVKNVKRSAAETADALNHLADDFKGYVNTEINTDSYPNYYDSSPVSLDDQNLVASAPIQPASSPASVWKNDEPTIYSLSPPPSYSPVINDEPDEIIDNVKEILPEPSITAQTHVSPNEIDKHVGQAVRNTTDAVDDIIKNLNDRQPQEGSEVFKVPDHNSPSGESGRDILAGFIDNYIPSQGIPNSDSLNDMRDISPDEEVNWRRGPVTIPYEVQQQQFQKHHQASAPVKSEVEDAPLLPSGLDALPSRPPTPPKSISDESVQPPAINLGPPNHPHERIPGIKSGILKRYSDVAPWFDFKTVDPAVLNVIYWRKPIKSISVLLSILFSLFLFSKLTVLVIVAYMSLAALVFTLSSRIYNLILARLNKSDGANPFAPYLAQEFEVPQEKVHAQVDLLLENSKITAEKLKRLFLVENICESVKFGLLLWTFSYIGTWFSGIGLVTLFVIGAFSIPKIYEIYKEPIDAQLAIAKEYFNKVQAIITEKVPFLAHCIPDAKKKN